MEENKAADFYKSLDFMKIGQAIHKGNWQSAAMTLRRMENKMKDSGVSEFTSNFQGLRQCINRKDKGAAKQILAVVIAKRAKFLNKNSENRKDT